MISKIIKTSLRLQFLVLILAAVLIVFGISKLREMPIDVYPEFSPPMVEVQTEALGLSASEMEAMITVPLEADMLNGVAWLDQIYSKSVAGMSSIQLIFEPGTDPIKARQMVQERLGEAFALPNVSKPPTIIQPLSSTSRVMMVGLSSKDVSLTDIGVLARWDIKPRLMGVPGVANVAIWGNRDRQLQVQVDPKRLQRADVTLDQIIATTGESLWVSPLSYLKSSTPGTAGFIDTPNQRFNINHRLPISSAKDLAKVSVVDSDVLLGDVATVVEDHQPLIGDAVLNNSSGLLLVIEKLPEANTLEVTKGVEQALEAMRPGLRGIEVDTTVFRPANYIEAAMGNLNELTLISAALVALVLGLFFLGWRSTLISLFIIPISLIAAGFILYLHGHTFNMMMLTGLVIALGVIIDDAIVDVDNIARRMRQKHPTTIFNAILETRSPLVYATLIILLTVTPLFFLPGLTGLFFQPLIMSYIVAVLVSLAVALIVTPALSLIILPNTGHPRLSPLVKKLENSYNKMLTRTVRAAYPALIVAIVIIVAGLVTLPFLKLSIMPSFKQTELLVQMDAKPNTSLPEMKRIIARTNQELHTIPGVQNVGAHIGRAITGDQTVGINSAQLWVNVKPTADYDATVASIKEVIATYPWLSSKVQTYQPARTNEALLGSDKDLVVRVYGNEAGVLANKAQEVRQAIAGIDGISEAQVDIHPNESQMEIKVDLAAAERYQIKPGDVRRQATTLLSGLQVGNLYKDQKVFDVVVWGVPTVRSNISTIRELLIETPRGRVPLKTLAEVRIVPTPIVIERDMVSRFVDVDITTDSRDPNTIMAEINRHLKDITFPLEYHAEVLSTSFEQQAAMQRIFGMIAIALLGSFLLLQAAFGKWRLAFVVLVTLPMSLAGGLVAIFLTGDNLSLGSLFGLLTVLGIAVRNGVLMISHFSHLQQFEGETFGRELVLRGARERLRPVLMTALAVAAALLPFVFFGNSAGTEIIHAMAVVILGGLTTSTLLTLFILPALYLRFGSGSLPSHE